MASVKDIIEQFRQGAVEYPQLVQTLASHDYSDPTEDERAAGSDWAQIYDRAESEPDDDSFYWVEAAVDDDVLTCDQVEQIVGAIHQYHSQQGSR